MVGLCVFVQVKQKRFDVSQFCRLVAIAKFFVIRLVSIILSIFPFFLFQAIQNDIWNQPRSPWNLQAYQKQPIFLLVGIGVLAKLWNGVSSDEPCSTKVFYQEQTNNRPKPSCRCLGWRMRTTWRQASPQLDCQERNQEIDTDVSFRRNSRGDIILLGKSGRMIRWFMCMRGSLPEYAD